MVIQIGLSNVPCHSDLFGCVRYLLYPSWAIDVTSLEDRICFKMCCSGHNAVLCTYNVLPAGTQLKIPKETEDRTAGSTPFPSIMWSKWTPAIQLRLVCSQPPYSGTWTWWEMRDVSGFWWMDVWDPEQTEIYLSVITFLICPYPIQLRNNIASLWRERQNAFRIV